MGVDGVSQSPPALGLGDPTWILVIQSFNSHFLTPAGSSEGQLGQGAREQVGSCTLHPPYFLLLSPPAFALAVPSAWSTLPSLLPQALLVIHVPALNSCGILSGLLTSLSLSLPSSEQGS